MQIVAISEAASSSTQWNLAQPQSRSGAPSSFPDTQQSASDVAADSSVPARAAILSPPMQDSVGSVRIATIAASFSTTVGGRNYSASVEESGGVYTASVPIPPGVSASGASVESAEINLNFVLDTLA